MQQCAYRVHRRNTGVHHADWKGVGGGGPLGPPLTPLLRASSTCLPHHAYYLDNHHHMHTLNPGQRRLYTCYAIKCGGFFFRHKYSNF